MVFENQIAELPPDPPAKTDDVVRIFYGAQNRESSIAVPIAACFARSNVLT